MDFDALETYLAERTSVDYDVEVTTWELGRFDPDDWSTRTYGIEQGVTAAIQYVRDQIKWYAKQGFYLTWKITRRNKK